MGVAIAGDCNGRCRCADVRDVLYWVSKGGTSIGVVYVGHFPAHWEDAKIIPPLIGTETDG